MADKEPSVRTSIDDIIDIYKKDVDVSLLRENLKLTVEQRLDNLTNAANFILEARESLRQQKLNRKCKKEECGDNNQPESGNPPEADTL